MTSDLGEVRSRFNNPRDFIPGSGRALPDTAFWYTCKFVFVSHPAQFLTSTTNPTAALRALPRRARAFGGGGTGACPIPSPATAWIRGVFPHFYENRAGLGWVGAKLTALVCQAEPKGLLGNTGHNFGPINCAACRKPSGPSFWAKEFPSFFALRETPCKRDDSRPVKLWAF